MSIASPPPASASPNPGKPARIGSDQLIETRIAEACNALWWAELVRTVLGMVVFAIAAVLIWVVIDQWIYSPGRLMRLAACLGLLALLGTYVYRRLRPLVGGSILPEYAARSLERDMPELRQSLTSYVTLRGDREAGDLRSRVVKSIGATTATRLRGHDALPQEATGTLRWWVATACALAVMVAYAAFSPKNTLQSAARLAAPIAAIDPPRRVSIREVQPGSAKAIAGRSVEISARIDGLRNGEEAVCYWQLPSGQQEFLLVDDPDARRHSGPLPLPHSASGIVRYTISAGDTTAGPFELTVQDVPVVALESVKYTPPKYTGQLPYSSSSGAITAVDGTSITILASTNRTVAKAKIEFNPRALGNRMQATAGATEMEIDAAGTSLSVSFPLRSARGRSAAVELEDYRILVWDAADQGNPDPIVYPIRVVPDLPPEVAITVPASSPKEVPIDAQQIIEVHASDPDFGLKSITLEIRAGIDLIAQPILWSSEAGEKGHLVAEYPLRPTELELRIGDTVQVVAIATDNRSSDFDPKVEPNVVRTDPVTLKITASGALPEENDPNADGLSSPDERSSENDQSGDSAGDSGKQQSGGGGAGSGAAQQSGGDQGEGGAGGEGTGSESSEDSSGSGGSGGTDADSSEPNQDDQSGSPQGAGGSQTGDSQSNEQSGDASTGQTPSGQGDEREDSAAQPAEAGDSSDDSAAGGGQDSPGPSGQAQDAAGGDSSGAGGANQASGQSGDSNNDAAGGGQQQDQQSTGTDSTGTDSTGTDSTGTDSTGTGGSEEGQATSRQPQAGDSPSGTEQSGAQSGTDGQPGSEPKRAPEHDGEAFERIQEYLEKNRPQEAEGSQSSGQQSDSPRDGQDSSGGQDAPGQPRGAEKEQQGPQGSQGKQGGQGDQTQEADGSSAGQESGGDQTATAGDSAQSDSAQSDSAQSDSDRSGRPQQSTDQGAADDRQSGQPDTSSGDSGEGTGKSGSSQEQPGDTSSGQGSEQTSGQDPAGESDSAKSDSDQNSGSSSSTQTASPEGGKPGAPNTTANASSAGAGDGGDQGDLSELPPVPPDPVNAEYAKRATDLVLDYLDQTREAPDPKLLEELNWSKEDLRQFAERWQQIRAMDQQPGAEGNRDVEEALKSLGLRPKTGAASTTRESADALKGIRDSGNRRPPPAAFRDAFDAFRRAVGQQE